MQVVAALSAACREATWRAAATAAVPAATVAMEAVAMVEAAVAVGAAAVAAVVTAAPGEPVERVVQRSGSRSHHSYPHRGESLRSAAKLHGRASPRQRDVVLSGRRLHLNRQYKHNSQRKEDKRQTQRRSQAYPCHGRDRRSSMVVAPLRLLLLLPRARRIPWMARFQHC